MSVSRITERLAERYLELGAWYEEIGDQGKAIETYHRVLAAVPDFMAAARRLEECNRRKGEGDKRGS